MNDVIKLYSYSQIGQDITVAEFFQFCKEGYFIEVGAYDGVFMSNTYMLEKQLGWKGICIEALPDLSALLRKNRSCACVQTAAYSTGGLNFEFSCGNPNGHNDCGSGIVKHSQPSSIALEVKKIEVSTLTLTEIMNAYQTPNFVEYLSIDTEGSELEVLCGIDWTKYSFGYINIEHNYIEPQRTEMRHFLEKQGYVFLRQNQWEDDYVRKVV